MSNVKKKANNRPSKEKLVNSNMRPICNTCNRGQCEINYNRNGITHYRTICTECKRNKQKKPPYKPKWAKSGYKKKTLCDQCGFKCVYSSQMTVYHIDGNLNNTSYTNLRTICLNCVEIIKKVNVNWKRGDLTVDY